MATTHDPAEYRRKWKHHIDQLHGIGHSVDDPETLQELLDTIDDLKDIVDRASEELA